jgi:hypothetical protein
MKKTNFTPFYHPNCLQGGLKNFNKCDVIPSKKGPNFIDHCRRRLGETRAEMYFF